MDTLRDRLLARRSWYHGFKQLIEADRAMRRVVADHIRPEPGDRILDVGCGDGDVRPLLGEVDYTGVDLNPDYIKAARVHENAQTRFLQADVSDLPHLGFEEFEIVLAFGVLHHLSDDECLGLVEAVSRVLPAGGRFVTIDPVFDPAQRTTARVLAALDRGRYVRAGSGYRQLIESSLAVKNLTIRHDLLRFPYSHCAIEATL
jgi:ubiquinone/menaquinone biosynthesis C-methylase UbiE